MEEGRSGRSREDHSTFINATISLRWLAVAALIAVETLLPAPVPRATLLALYSAILAYTLALTLYVWRYPEGAGRAARWGVPLDTLAIVAGMLLSDHVREFLVLAFPVAATAGTLLGYPGATLVAGAVVIVQIPANPASLFSTGEYLRWAFAALAILGTGAAAAAAAARLAGRQEFARTLVSLRRAVGTAPTVTAAAQTALAIIVDRFRAHSGSVMLYDPQAGRLEIMAGHQIQAAYRDTRPRLGEGIAGWVVQEGRPILLTPDATIPFRLERSEIGSSMCVPLRGPRGPLGVLNLNRPTASPWFTQENLEAAELAAQQIVGVLSQAQHERIFAAALSEMAEGFGEVSRALSRDPSVLWPALLDVARSLTSAHFAILALEREDTGNVDIVASRGISGRAVHQFAPTLLAASTQGEIRIAQGGPAREGAPTQVACVPLRIGSQTMGALGLGISDGQMIPQVLQAVAAHVAVAVHTARSAHRIADIGVAEERHRIAREMHDGLAQTLAEALLQTDLSSIAAQTSPEQLASDLKSLRTLLERAMRELREFMTELRRHDEAEGTLFAALEAMGRDFGRRQEIATSVSVTGDDAALPSAMRHAVLAIVRQALTNIRAHAQASAVTIRGEVNEQACTVSVADNGTGFDLAAYRARAAATHHLGITSMEERASLVGGSVQITTAPGKGTTVRVLIPLGRDHDEDSRAAG